MAVRIAELEKTQAAVWAQLRSRLWPTASPEELRTEVAAHAAGGHTSMRLVLLAWDDANPIGFAEISERNIADGCGDAPVAYLEGWYVDPAHQRQGIGRRLLAQAEAWATAVGYTYLASDTEIGNTAGEHAHLAVGFQETGRVIQYRKRLPHDA